MEAQDARKLCPKAQEDLRRRVVNAVIRQEMTKSDAARTFGVGRTSVYCWLAAYQAGGHAALKSKARGRPKRFRLKGYQAATIVRIITDGCPDKRDMPFVLWTRDAVRELIAEYCGIHVSVWTVGRYLKRWGFTPQKPVRLAYERDPKAVRRWLQEEYPAIKRQATRERAEIYWGDEMGLRSDHQTGTSFGRRGQTPVIPGTGKRFGCNMISAITNRGRLAFMVFRQRFTGAVMIDFLRRLLRHAQRKVFLVVDGHPVHRSARVRAWIKKHKRRIRLFQLPGYSPELNPDELLNQDVKSNAVGRRRPHDQEELLDNVRSYLRSTQKYPAVIINYVQEEHVSYAG